MSIYYPISRGNRIEIQMKPNFLVVIHDHSYNSSYESLLIMFQQNKSDAIFVFTPLKEIASIQEKYININNVIEKKKQQENSYFLFFVPDPSKEVGSDIILNGAINTYEQTHEAVVNSILTFIQEKSSKEKQLEIFIKGANSFNMYKIVLQLLSQIVS
jgi:hypothetical protein